MATLADCFDNLDEAFNNFVDAIRRSAISSVEFEESLARLQEMAKAPEAPEEEKPEFVRIPKRKVRKLWL